MKKILSASCIILMSVLLSCSANKAPHSNQKSLENKHSIEWQKRADKNIEQLVQRKKLHLSSQSDYEHMRWVAKASLFLRGQKELTSETDDLQKLQSLSQEQVVELFLASDDFYNTVADFSLYYLGFRIDPLFINGSPNSRVFNFSQALTAVISLADQKSFLNLFNLTHPQYVPPFLKVDETVLNDLKIPFTNPLTDQQKRHLVFETALKKVKLVQTWTDDEIKKNESSLCHFLIAFENPFVFPPPQFSQKLGIPSQIYDNLKNFYISIASYEFCSPTFAPSENASFSISNLQLLKDYLPGAIQFFETNLLMNKEYDSSVYKISSLRYAKTLKPQVIANQVGYMNSEISAHLSNSSTNMNRKRGAYILKNFFCDDLTPVNVQIVDNHAGAHGSNPSCYACHYKLDPMAGFFKNYGFSFADFSNAQEITFDDLKTANKETYQKQWLKPGTQDWNIGYIQSTKLPHLNQYGENLEDLHQILQTHPEVKKCLIKRILEYSTEPSQLYDNGFIQDIAQIYIQEEKTSPAEAFKNIFRKTALSKTFAAENRTPTECYDLKQGVDPSTRPPCEVAHILESQCVRCHKSTTGLNSLDLSKWIDTGLGKMGFAHLDEATGQQIEAKKTFSTMLERITSSDEDLRMPPGDMNPVYRQILFKWLSQKQGE